MQDCQTLGSCTAKLLFLHCNRSCIVRPYLMTPRKHPRQAQVSEQLTLHSQSANKNLHVHVKHPPPTNATCCQSKWTVRGGSKRIKRASKPGSKFQPNLLSNSSKPALACRAMAMACEFFRRKRESMLSTRLPLQKEGSAEQTGSPTAPALVIPATWATDCTGVLVMIITLLLLLP